MASPQIKNGYSMITNEILDAICKFKLNGTQNAIIYQIWRYTYGFSRKSHTLSETFLSKGTGVSKVKISSELKNLIENKVVLVIADSTFTKSRELAFNENYDEWGLKRRQLTKTLTPNQNIDTTVDEKVNTTVNENVNQDKQYLKQNLKQNNCANECNDFFEMLWSLYPNKKGKAQVSGKSKKDLQKLGLETVKTCIDRYVSDKPNWKQFQNGSTFFNGGYIDYLDENYTKQPLVNDFGFHNTHLDDMPDGLTSKELEKLYGLDE